MCVGDNWCECVIGGEVCVIGGEVCVIAGESV